MAAHRKLPSCGVRRGPCMPPRLALPRPRVVDASAHSRARSAGILWCPLAASGDDGPDQREGTEAGDAPVVLIRTARRSQPSMSRDWQGRGCTPLPLSGFPRRGRQGVCKPLLGPLDLVTHCKDRAPEASCRHHQHPLSIPASRNPAMRASRHRGFSAGRHAGCRVHSSDARCSSLPVACVGRLLPREAVVAAPPPADGRTGPLVCRAAGRPPVPASRLRRPAGRWHRGWRPSAASGQPVAIRPRAR